MKINKIKPQMIADDKNNCSSLKRNRWQRKLTILTTIFFMILSSVSNLFILTPKVSSAEAVVTVTYVDQNGKSMPGTRQTTFTYSEITTPISGGGTKLDAVAKIPGYEIDYSASRLKLGTKKPSFNNNQGTLSARVQLLIDDPLVNDLAKTTKGLIPPVAELSLVYKVAFNVNVNYTYTSPENKTSPISDHPSVSMPYGDFPAWFLSDKIVINKFKLDLVASKLTFEGTTKTLKEWFPTATTNNVQALLTVLISSKTPTSDITLSLSYVDRIAIVGNSITVSPGDLVSWKDLVNSVTVEGVAMTDFSKVKFMDANNNVIDTTTKTIVTANRGSTLYHITYSDANSTSNIGYASVNVVGKATIVSKYVDATTSTPTSLQPDVTQSTYKNPIFFKIPENITKNGYVYIPILTKSSLAINTDGAIQGPIVFDSTYKDFPDVFLVNGLKAGIAGAVEAAQTTYTIIYGYVREIILAAKNTTVSVGDSVKPTDLVASLTLGGKAVDLSTATIIVKNKETGGTVVPITTTKKGVTDYWITFADGTNVSTPQKATVTVYPKATMTTYFVDSDNNKLADPVTKTVTKIGEYLPFAPPRAINGVNPSIDKSHYEHTVDTNTKPIVSENGFGVFNTTDWNEIFKPLYRTSGGDEVKGFTINTAVDGSNIVDNYTLTYVYEMPKQVATLQIEGKDKETINGTTGKPITFLKYTDANLAVAGMTYKVINPNGNVYSSLKDALAARPDGLFDGSEIIGGVDNRIQTFNVVYQPANVPITGVHLSKPQISLLPLWLAGLSIMGVIFYLKKRKQE